MLSQEVSRTGQPIFARDGKILSSRVDPILEASKWLDSQREVLRSSKRVFVLGLGSGYHLQTLCKEFPHVEVVVLEADQDLLPLSKIWNLPSSATCVWFDSLDDLFQSEKFTSTIQKSFVLLSFAPAMQGHFDLYRQVQEVLISRTVFGLKLLLSVRSDTCGLDHLFRPTLSSVGPDSEKFNSLFSIHHVLAGLEVRSSDDSHYRSVLLWRTLGELVK